MPIGAPAEMEKAADSAYIGNAVPPAQQDRLVIQNADYTLVVTDPKAKMDQMTALAQTLGGFVVSANLYQTTSPNGNQVPEGSIVIRVPANKLEEALKQVKADVVEIRNETRSGQDVTQEYVDLESRLKNLQAAEAQLTRIMEDANRTEDVMSVFNQLVYYREQIELVKGQMQYYEQSANYSAISARLIAEESIQPIQVGGWKPQGEVRDAIQTTDQLPAGFRRLPDLGCAVLPAGAAAHRAGHRPADLAGGISPSAPSGAGRRRTRPRLRPSRPLPPSSPHPRPSPKMERGIIFPMEKLVQQAQSCFGIRLNANQAAALTVYEQELLEWNGKFNLTAIRDTEGIRTKHFLDSMSCALAWKDQPPRSLVDVGTGAGFPGLVLKILYPGMALTLIESVGKKASFCQHMVEKLALER